MRPRREQTAVTVRSDKLAQRLKVLTRNGRSQAEVLERAIDLVPPDEDELEVRRRRLRELTEIIAADPLRYRSMAEFDAEEYDENGFPR